MCGIAGLWDPSLDRTALEAHAARFCKSLLHRGPDAQSSWVEAPLALAHTRLAIQGLGPQGAQPKSLKGRGTLVYNGELFGVSALAQQLSERGYQWSNRSDTDLLLHAIAEFGFPDVLGRISGQFAFAYVDERSRTLFFARDRLGIRPFYYSRMRDRFAFASEQKALLTLDWVEPTFRTEQLLRYLTLGRSDDVLGQTMLENVQSLPPGHWGSWDGERLLVHRYYRIPSVTKRSTIPELRETLRSVIRDQLVGEVPLGSMVSGGLDSSSIALITDDLRMSENVDTPLHLFLYHDQKAESDESDYQKAVLGAVRSRHEVHWVSSSPAQFRRELSTYIHHQEEPFQDLSSYAEFTIAKRAHEVGVKVLLNGLGGDEVFVGYPSYLGSVVLELLTSGKFRTVAQLFEHVPEITGNRAGRRALAAQAAYYLIPPRARNALTAARSGRARGVPFPSIVEASKDAYAHWHTYDTDHPRSRANAALRSSLESWSVPRFLTHSDRMVLAHSVEGRVPLLDERLLEVAFGIPLEDRIGEHGLKHALRQAAAPYLPTLVRERKSKLGFHAPLNPYLTEIDDILRDGMSELTDKLPGFEARWEDLPSPARWSFGALGLYAKWVKGRAEKLSF